MAQINLRQADVFKRNIAGYLKSNSLSNSVQISVYDPNSGNTIANARADFNSRLSQMLRLQGVLANIKFAVAGVNDASGVDAMLNEREKNKEVLVSLERFAGDRAAPLQQAVDAQIASQVKRNQTSDYGSTDTITIPLLDQKALDEVKGQVLALKRRQTEINEAVLGTNLSKSVTISDDDYKFLQDLGII